MMHINEENMGKQKLYALQVALVTHYYTTGQPDLLAEFLRGKVRLLIIMRHPFYYCKDVSSSLIIIEDGSSKIEKRFNFPKVNELLLYLRDMILTIFVILSLRRNLDVYIGADPLNAFAGLILKQLRKVRKVIFYTIDLPVSRFKNEILNILYHKLDIFCASKCDFIWDLSPRMELVRKAFGWKLSNSRKMIVPSAFPLKAKQMIDETKICRLLFVGHLKESQGLQLAIESMPTIIEKVPNIKLLVIGGGPFQKELQRMVSEYSLDSHVLFLGYINKHSEIEEILSEGGVGIAPYVPDPKGITRYADPMKLKVYLACGLPVIVTDVPWMAEIIKKYDAGIVIKYNKNEFIDAVIKLMTNRELYFKLRENALKLAQKYTPEEVFGEALLDIISS